MARLNIRVVYFQIHCNCRIMRKLTGNIFFSLLTTAAIALVFFACGSKQKSAGLQKDNTRKIRVTDMSTDRDAYRINDEVKLSYTFINEEASDVIIKNITVRVKDISNTSFPVVYEKEIESRLMLNAKGKSVGKTVNLWKIPVDAEKTVCGVCLTYEIDKKATQFPNQIFFRIVNEDDVVISLNAKHDQPELLTIAGIGNIELR